MYDVNSLLSDLQALGIRADGRPLLVHSALRAAGPINGGAQAVIRALMAALGSGGSLLFPNLNIPHEFSATNPPRFDLQRDPIRKTLGALPQYFKEHHAEAFSRHPTHSMMGAGPACDALFGHHEHAGMPCGPGTPWWRLAESDGLILLLGVTQQNNTSIHGPEEVHGGYQLSADVIDGVVIDGGRDISVRSRLHVWGNASDFSRINPWLEAARGLRRGRIGSADCLLVDARVFQRQVCERLQAQPRFLLQ